MPPQRTSLWYEKTPDAREDGRRHGFLTPTKVAAKLALAGEEYLATQRRTFPRLPEAEVEEVVRAIPDAPDKTFNPDDLMPMLRNFHYRHGVAESSHRFERRRLESRVVPGHPDREMAVEVSPEHPVNVWLRSQSDPVVLALIRENPQWLRNAAVADRICKWREDLVKGNYKAGKLLFQLSQAGGVGRGTAGKPSNSKVAAPARRAVIAALEEEARATRAVWLNLLDENSGVGLMDLGIRMLRRLHGFDSPALADLPAGSKAAQTRDWLDFYGRLTEPQLLRHLGELLLIVKNRDDDAYVVIDEKAWPRARALALVVARWNVSKRWIREGLSLNGQ